MVLERQDPPAANQGATDVSHDQANVPELTPLEVRINQTGTRTVVIRCPWCGCLHRHGWPANWDDGPGHRLAHCVDNERTLGVRAVGYWIGVPA